MRNLENLLETPQHHSFPIPMKRNLVRTWKSYIPVHVWKWCGSGRSRDLGGAQKGSEDNLVALEEWNGVDKLILRMFAPCCIVIQLEAREVFTVRL